MLTAEDLGANQLLREANADKNREWDERRKMEKDREEVKIITHFPSDCPDCDCEYSFVTVHIGGQRIAGFGDESGGGHERATAFAKGYLCALNMEEQEIIHEDIADDNDDDEE